MIIVFDLSNQFIKILDLHNYHDFELRLVILMIAAMKMENKWQSNLINNYTSNQSDNSYIIHSSKGEMDGWSAGAAG